MENYIMENYIYTSHRTYIVDVMECDDGMYKLEIHDDNGTYHYPKYFINEGYVQDPRFFNNCDVKDSIAINLTRDDIKKFITTVKNYCDSAIKGGNYGRL